MGNASSRSQPPGPQGAMQTGAQFASYLYVCSLGETDAQEYIIYVNDTPFDISAFEAQFGSIYKSKEHTVWFEAIPLPPAIAQQYAGDPKKDWLLKATCAQGKADSLSASLTAVKLNKAVHDACKKLKYPMAPVR